MSAVGTGAGPSAEGRSAPALRVFLVLALVGAAVSVALGVYGQVHGPTGREIATFGFPSMLDMKAWLTTAGLALGVLQVATALRMFGRIGSGPSGPAVAMTHRISGTLAVLCTLPVAYHCLWSLGFGTYSARVLVHSLVGCLFYGVFVTKMLALRSRRLPSWALPWLGGTLFAALVTIWLTSSLWFFTTANPLY